jgi:hypothetical protein
MAYLYVTFFSATVDGRNLRFGLKLHIGTPYRGKRFLTHQIPTSCLPILLIFLKNQQSRQTGSRNPMGSKTLPTIWGTYMKLVTKYQISAIISCWGNNWWQKSDIWSQASYRYAISWEAFFDPSDSYFLFAKERGYHRWALAHSSSDMGNTYMKLVSKYQISAINSCWEKCDEKWAYMFNV